MTRTYSLRQYERLDDDDGYWSELSRGQLVREPRPGALHTDVVTEVGGLMREYVRQHDLGKIVIEGQAFEHDEIRWLTSAELLEMDLAPSDRRFTEEVLSLPS